MSIEFRGTTICAVKKDGHTAIAGDGQVTMSESVIFKNNAVKVRRIYGGKVIFGFAGSVADAFTLSERFSFPESDRESFRPFLWCLFLRSVRT